MTENKWTREEAWIGKGLKKYVPNKEKLSKLNKKRERSTKQNESQLKLFK